jgi:sulfite reductase (NADPH) flavoprotein alpha-component
VEPGSTEPAILSDWRLVFNITHPFAFEGSVANVMPETVSVVHGALHACADEVLHHLDSFEGFGVYYERVQLEVRTYAGELHPAYVYVGLPTILKPEGRPSLRYRNILVDGGRDVGLVDDYLDRLMSIPIHPVPGHPPFTPPRGNSERITLQELAARPLHTAFAGYVFDMSEAGPQHQTLTAHLEGHDVTLFFLQRMDSSIGDEVMNDIDLNHLTEAQQRYLNDYLHEFCIEYKYVGRLV